MSLTRQLFEFAGQSGADAVGVVSAVEYEAKVPNLQKPSTTVRGMKSLVCFVKHMLTGAFATRDIPIQSMNSHLVMEHIDRISMDLCDWLEGEGYLAVPVPPESADMDLQKSPAGTLDFKWVAEEAGLGTVGLELNLLTPDYGPRVYIGVVMTDAPLQPTPRLEQHLCPGLQCGRCAAICPTRAIPLRARRGAHLSEYRALDKKACAGGAERIGIKPFLLNLRRLLFARPAPQAARALEHVYWKDFWQSVNCRLGAFAACFECFYVCPPGRRDFRKIIRIPYRRRDLPPGSLKTRVIEEMMEVVHQGVPAERRGEYSRDEDFGSLIAPQEAR